MIRRLYYTFGTLILLAVVIVCVINFLKDGRGIHIPMLNVLP